MPFTLVVRSDQAPARYWEVTYKYVNQVDATRRVAHGEMSWVVATDNPLPTPSIIPIRTYVDNFLTSIDGVISGTGSAHDEPVGTGAEVNITFPKYQASWGNLYGCVPILVGGVIASNTLITTDLFTPELSIQGGEFSSGSTAQLGAGPKSPGPGENWGVGEAWVPAYACGSPNLWMGREPLVARQRYEVCDPNYLNFTDFDATHQRHHDFAGATEGFHFNGPDDLQGYTGNPGTNPYLYTGSGNITAWAASASNLSRTIYLTLGAPWYGAFRTGGVSTVPPFGAYSEAYEYKTRFTMSGVYLYLQLYFDGVKAPESSAYDSVGLDSFDDIIACCWQTAPNGGKKQVLIGLQRGVEKNFGSGSGSTSGWDVYNYGDIDQRSPIGFLFLPNGWLFLSFNTYDGSGNATAMYTVNKKHGERPASNWSAPATLTPNASQALGIGRNMGQAFRTRIGA